MPDAPAPPALIRVLLFAHEKPRMLSFRGEKPWTLRASHRGIHIDAGTAVHFRCTPQGIEAQWNANRETASRFTLLGPGPHRVQAAGRSILTEGTLEITGTGMALAPRLEMSTAHYVLGVLHSEMGSAPPAALEAMAVCIRSFTWRAAERPRHPSAHTCDATHCQRYRPSGTLIPALRQAVEQTRGQFRAWHSEPAETLWHAACGGFLSSAHEAFGREDIPYLPAQPDKKRDGGAWCDVPSGRWKWTTKLSQDQWGQALQRAGFLRTGDTRPHLKVGSRSIGGRVLRIQWGESVAQAITGQTFWEMVGPTLGWNGLRSLHFRITPTPSGWTLSGVGLGHGVGLCQAGAIERARAGWGREAILDTYFPGTQTARTTRLRRGPAW
jgi:stage II sporulation protein D